MRYSHVVSFLGVVALAQASASGVTILESGWYLADEFFLNGAYSARHNPVDGRIYAASRVTGATAGIYVFDASGVATHLVTIDTPAGLAIAENGDVFYALDSPGTIERLPFGTTTPSTWVSGFHAGDDDPIGLSIAPADANFSWLSPGDALVADRGNSGPDEIWRWDPDLAEGETVVHEDLGASILVNPVDIAIGASRIWITDDVGVGAGVIYSITADGTVTPMPGPGVSRPAAVDVDPSNQSLIVNDADGDRIVRIDETTGAVSTMFDGFINLAANCVDVFDNGNAILVSDFGTNKVHLFRRTRTYCINAPINTLNTPSTFYPTQGRLVAIDGSMLMTHNGADPSFYFFKRLNPDGTWANVTGGCPGCDFPLVTTAIDIDADLYALGGTTPSPGFVFAGTVPGSHFDDAVADGSDYGVTGFGAELKVIGIEILIGAPSHANGHVFSYQYDPDDPYLDPDYELALPAFGAQTGGMSPNFGYSIDCDGDTLIIGAPGVDVTGVGQDAGAAYIYKRNPGTGVWTLGFTATGGAAGDRFGFDVAVNGQTAAVGAPYANGFKGLVHRLHCDSGTWQLSTVMSNVDVGAMYGWKVALSPDTLVIGAPGTFNYFANAGYLYVHTKTDPVVWNLTAFLAGDQLNERVGESFDISDDNLLMVGLPYTDVGGNPDQGLVVPFPMMDCTDCNGDALPDTLQIVAGSPDADTDGILDECEPITNATAGSIHPTIQDAVDRAIGEGAPDAIEVPPGEWVESFLIERDLVLTAQDPGDPPVMRPETGAAATIRNGAVVSLDTLRFGDATPGRAGSDRAIDSLDSTVLATNLTVTGFTNTAARIEGGSATFSDCRFVQNSCEFGHPMALFGFIADSVTIERCAFIGNAGASAEFGTVGAYRTPVVMTDSVFLGNHADQDLPPALWFDNDDVVGVTLRVTNCNFLHNTSDSGFSVIVTESSETPYFANCIFLNNGSLYPTEDAWALSVFDYCLSETVLFPGGGNIAADPVFTANPSPGPDTVWGTEDDTGDMTPWIGSPLIDAAEGAEYQSITGVEPQYAFDIAGNTRAIEHPGYNGPGDPMNPGLDIGAYEAPASTPTPCSGDVTGDSITNSADFNVLAGNYGAGPGATRAQGDLTGDGFVNSADFNILAGDFGCGG